MSHTDRTPFGGPPIYSGSRDRVPVWLREIPDYVIESDDALDVWIHVRRLPAPRADVVEGERRYRRFRAQAVRR